MACEKGGKVWCTADSRGFRLRLRLELLPLLHDHVQRRTVVSHAVLQHHHILDGFLQSLRGFGVFLLHEERVYVRVCGCNPWVSDQNVSCVPLLTGETAIHRPFPLLNSHSR